MKKFYFAGVESYHGPNSAGDRSLASYLKEYDVENCLYSYHNLSKSEYLGQFDNVFLDSGAFSAKMQGVEITVEEYGNFVLENKDKIDHYANLDVIGDAEASYNNQKRLEKMGLQPLPVFHTGEDFKWLKKYVDEGYEYILLGGMVGKRTDELMPWLRKCFGIIPEDRKVHAFGVARQSILEKFDFYSADATNWCFGSKFGYMYYFDRGELHRYRHEDFADKFAAMEKHWKRHLWNIIQWKKYAEYLKEEKV